MWMHRHPSIRSAVMVPPMLMLVLFHTGTSQPKSMMTSCDRKSLLLLLYIHTAWAGSYYNTILVLACFCCCCCCDCINCVLSKLKLDPNPCVWCFGGKDRPFKSSARSEENKPMTTRTSQNQETKPKQTMQNDHETLSSSQITRK